MVKNEELFSVYYNTKSLIVTEKKYGSSMSKHGLIRSEQEKFCSGIQIDYTNKDSPISIGGTISSTPDGICTYPNTFSSKFLDTNTSLEVVNKLLLSPSNIPVIFFVRNPKKKLLSGIQQAIMKQDVGYDFNRALNHRPEAVKDFKTMLRTLDTCPNEEHIIKFLNEIQRNKLFKHYVEIFAVTIESTWKFIAANGHYYSNMELGILRFFNFLENRLDIPDNFHILNLDEIGDKEASFLYELGWLPQKNNLSENSEERHSHPYLKKVIYEVMKIWPEVIDRSFNRDIIDREITINILKNKYGKFFIN